MVLEIQQFDLSVHQWFQAHQSELLRNVFEWVSFIADPLPMLFLSAILVITLVVQRDWKETLIADIALVTGLGLHYLLKIGVGRVRPDGAELIETTPSFPSGHSTMSFLFFALVIFYALPEVKSDSLRFLLRAMAVVMMILIPLSRVYLGLHWMSDVLAGVLLGAIIFVASIIAAKKFTH